MNIEFSLSQTASDKVMAMVNAKGGEWPRTAFACRFIEPGLVHYNDYGTVLVSKPALDKMAQSFVGKPVINEIHKEVDHTIFKEGDADGIVSRVWYNATDGWYWCDFLVWDPATRRNCESAAYSVSCAYTVSNANAVKGEHNNIPYEQEILDGAYTHLAVVANPRYEGARIVYNSKGGNDMKFNLKFWQNKDKKVELTNLTEESPVEIDGKDVSIKDLIEVYNAATKKAEGKIAIDSIIDIDGKQVLVKDLIEAFKLKNASDDDDKKKKDKDDMENAHKNGLHNSRLENCSMCNAEDDDDKKKKKDDDERKNAEEKKKADELRNAAVVRGEPQKAEFSSRSEKAEKGAKMFGSSK